MDMRLHANFENDHGKVIDKENKAMKQEAKPRNYLFDLDIDLFIRPEALYSSAISEPTLAPSSAKKITESVKWRTTSFDLDIDLLINPDHLNVNPQKQMREKIVSERRVTKVVKDLDMDLLMTPDTFSNRHPQINLSTAKIIASSSIW
jgi:hypothetical protein